MKRSMVLAAVTVALMLPGVAQAKRYSLYMTFGQDILLAGKEDDVAIRAQCVLNEGGYDIVRVYAKVAANSVMRGSYDSFLGNGSYLTALTPAASAEVALLQNLSTGEERFVNAIDSGFVLNLTTMHGFVWTNESTIGGLNSGGHDCILSINVDAIKKFKVVE